MKVQPQALAKQNMWQPFKTIKNPLSLFLTLTRTQARTLLVPSECILLSLSHFFHSPFYDSWNHCIFQTLFRWYKFFSHSMEKQQRQHWWWLGQQSCRDRNFFIMRNNFFIKSEILTKYFSNFSQKLLVQCQDLDFSLRAEREFEPGTTIYRLTHIAKQTFYLVQRSTLCTNVCLHYWKIIKQFFTLAAAVWEILAVRYKSKQICR